jgi:hypothetical protein
MRSASGRISPTGTVLLASAKEETAEGIEAGELMVGVTVQLHSQAAVIARAQLCSG